MIKYKAGFQMDGEQVADVDKISNLPMEIIDAVPLKDAVRTSILSNKWRHKWVTISHLVFGFSYEHLGTRNYDSDEIDDYLPESIIHYLDHHNPAVSNIDQVLLRHQGSVSKFELTTSVPSFSHHIDRWMLYLSSKGIKELTLRSTYIFQHYRIPTSLFQFRELTRLDLSECTLKLPSTFEGFPSLKILHLYSVKFVSCVADNLISKCTLLERLQLNSCEPRCEKINAPGLKFLCVFGECGHLITLKNTTLLESAYVPLSLFCFQELTDLHLGQCNFQVPSTFEGFPFLRRLGLREVNFVNCNVDILILKSPLLEILELSSIDHSYIKSNAPGIKILRIGNGFVGLFPVYMKQIIGTMSDCLGCDGVVIHPQHCECNILHSLSHFPNIMELDVMSYGLRQCVVTNITRRLATALDHLENLTLQVNFEDTNQILATLCLLRSSPNLQKLEIRCRWHDAVALVAKAEEELDIMCLKSLQTVKVVELTSLSNKWEYFIKMVLAYMPVLEKLTIEFNIPLTNGEASRILEELRLLATGADIILSCESRSLL